MRYREREKQVERERERDNDMERIFVLIGGERERGGMS